MNTNFGGSKPNWKVFMLFSLTLEENARTKQQEEQAEIQRRIYNQNPNHIPRPTRNQTRINNEELTTMLSRPLSSFNAVQFKYIITKSE